MQLTSKMFVNYASYRVPLNYLRHKNLRRQESEFSAAILVSLVLTARAFEELSVALHLVTERA